MKHAILLAVVFGVAVGASGPVQKADNEKTAGQKADQRIAADGGATDQEKPAAKKKVVGKRAAAVKEKLAATKEAIAIKVVAVREKAAARKEAVATKVAAALKKLTPNREKRGVQARAKAFLETYEKEYAVLAKASALASWEAACQGNEENFDAAAAASLAVRKLQSDPKRYRQIQRLLKAKDRLDPLDVRSLTVIELGFKGNQLSPEMLEKMVDQLSDIEQTFNTFRATIDGKAYSNNDLLGMIGKETDSAKRKEMWDALKQVGAAVGPKLIELTKLRNEAARSLGYDNYWEMEIRLQEHDPEQLIAIFDNLEELTNEPYRVMKAELDGELSRRFGIAPDAMMPWHYDNPFFQAAPPSEGVNLNEFYREKTKEEIVDLAKTFYRDIGLPVDPIVERSDLFEREGKDQHAFCTSIDRADDVRTLCNVKPTAEWADTMLHELGHAIYDVKIDRSLPYSLREPTHIFTTEAIAMMFGALGKNPRWMIDYAGADPDRIAEVRGAILEQRRREQLIFARWTMVMLNFEKSMYEDPDQDLNKLWWDCVERYQGLTRPEGRDLPDWAAKPHFTCAPVYYHNYMLGELFAAQMRAALAKLAGHEGPTAELSFTGRKDFGDFVEEKVFKPGATMPWPEFVKNVTGEELSAKHFAKEVQKAND